MFERSPWKALLLVGFGLALAGCTNNLVDSIVVAPSTQSLLVGQTVQFTATASQSHGNHPSSSSNVTNLVTWTSSSPSIATVNASGLATAVSAGSTTITASMQGFGGVISNSAVLTVTGSGSTSPEPLTSLAIDPGAQTALALNQTLNFIAIGTTGAGATVNLTGQPATVGTSTIKAATWFSSSPQVATVNPSTGVATALTSGSTTITAQAVNPDGTVVIGTATLTVSLPTASPEPLVSMAIIPGTQTLTSLNQPAQFIAIGTTGTGTTVNLTNKVIWTSSSPTVASINANTGLATALSNGTAAITAVATNPDGTVVTGVGSVTVNIAATGEPLVSLTIVPVSQTTSVVGQTVQYTAIGTTSTGATVNLTNQPATIGGATINAAVWGSSSTAVATINQATGLAAAVSSGTVAITAQAKNPDGTVVTGTATFTVISTPEPLIALSIVPGTQTLDSAGETAQYVAIGTTASGATVNLTNVKATIGTATINAATWSSSSASVAAINPVTGLATAGVSGITVVSAVAYNPDGTAVTATATLNVNITATQEPLVSLAIVPGTQTTSAVNQTAQFIAIGTTSSGATVNLTNQTATVNGATINAAVWGSSSAAVATINPATGLATSVSPGTVAITAQAKNPDGTVVTGTAVFVVTSTTEPLVSLTIVPGAQTVSTSGETVQYVAIGTTQSGATVNLTNTKATIGAATINAAAWSSSTTAVASIGPLTGVATAATSGITVITAVAYNPDGTAVTGTSTLSVSLSSTQEPLVSLTVLPLTQTVSVVGQTAQYIALGTTSSGTTVNLTNQSATVNGATINAAVWGSSSNAIAIVNPASGAATAVSSGTIAVSAQAKNPDGTVVTGTATFIVTPAPEPLVSLTIVPANQTLATAGETEQYVAIGTTSTGATVNLTNVKAIIGGATINAATWASSTTSVATINSATGLAVAGTSGITVITAIAFNPDGTAVTGTATLNVNIAATPEPLVSLAIVPATQTASVTGQTAQFIAIGTTSSGATVNLTNQSATIGAATINAAVWGSSSTDLATINAATGLATAVSSGTVAITAQAKNPDGTVVTAAATFTVIPQPEPLISLTIVPGAQTLASAGEPVQFIAIGTTATGATVNLTNVKASIGGATINAATWASSTTTVATINPATGLAAAATSGVSVITAIAINPDGTAVTATATLTVNLSTTPEPLISLAIVPASQTASVTGQTAQFIAIGTTSSGATVNLTNQSATIGAATINPAVWGSSSNAIGTINPATGVATAVTSGTVAITAQAKNPDGTVVTGTATFTVISTPEPLISLTVVPAAQTLATAGEPVHYVAIGTTASGATVNLTGVKATIGTATINAATWASTSPTVASIDPASGIASALTSGITIITATAINPDGTAVIGTATLTVNLSPTPEPLVSLAIVPATQTASVTGQTAQFIAIGTTSSGATVNLTNQSATVGAATINAAVWGSSSTAVATVNSATGVATAVSTGTVAITAQAKNPDGTVVTAAATFTVISTPEPLISLAIVPNTQALSGVGQTAQFIAIGTTATGATVNLTNVKATIGGATINAATWGSSNVAVATVNPITGLATAATTGVTVITAIASNPDGTAVTATATLTANISATPEPLVSLAIVPASQTTLTGQTAQFIAIGTTSSGTTVNLTNQTATIGAATISPAVWASSSTPVATVNAATGLATAVTAGTVAITAQAKNPDGTVVTGVATFTVTTTPEPLVSMTIIPVTQTLTAVGQPAQFIAIGTTSSGATVNLTNVSATFGSATIAAATWSSSTLPVATINAATGIATAGTSGVTVITAIAYNPDGSAVTGTATLTVNPNAEPIVSLAIVPASQTASVTGQTAQFIAIGTTSSGATVNLTNQTATVGAATINPAVWGSSSAPIATINSATGLATAVSSGTVAITAQAKNPDGSSVVGTATFTVNITPEPMISMAIVPASATLSLIGQTANLQAIATTSSNATVNLTNQSATIGTATILPAVWVSSVPGVATVNPGTGVVTAVNAGTTAITASAINPDGTVVTGVAVITVTATGGSTLGAIASITVIPNSQTVAAPNDTAQYLAIGTSTTGATVDLTSLVAWKSSSAEIGTIGAATGLATGTGQGTATMTAVYTPGGGGNVVTGNSYFTVAGGSNETYTAVTIIPGSQTLSVGQSSNFVALGTLGTNGLKVDVTNSPSIQWISDVPTIATVGLGTGVGTGVSAGNATVTAELTNPDGTVVSADASVTVSQTTVPEPLLSLQIIPAALSVGDLQDTGQFLAIGTFSVVPYVRDLTNSPGTTWISSFPSAFPVSTNSGGTPSASAGIVTAYGTGSTTIIAEATSADGTIQTATASFSCPLMLPNPSGDPPTPGSCDVGETGPLTATLTVYGEGLNTTNWVITAPSATATPNVIHCGPGWTANGNLGGSVCTGIYPIGTTVTLTAAQSPSAVNTSTFGGWTYNCTPTPATPTAAGPNSCTIVLGETNATVGAIFN